MLIMNGLISHDVHVGNSIAKIKNGSQQQTNAPVKVGMISFTYVAKRRRKDNEMAEI